MNEQDTFELIRPFGPPIGKFPLPFAFCQIINSLVDSYESGSDVGLEPFGDNLAGEVKSELKLSHQIMESSGLEAYLIRCVKAYVLRASGNIVNTCDIKQCWVVRQFPGEYNPVHWHSLDISGAGWLKLPNRVDHGYKTNNYDGNIAFIHGSRQFLSDSDLILKPQVGLLTLFPNYLMHQVYPFKGEGERRSLAFNASIDAKVGNVYGN